MYGYEMWLKIKVVQKLDSIIHWINHSAVDIKYI